MMLWTLTLLAVLWGTGVFAQRQSETCLQPTSTGNICPGAAPNKSYLRFSFDPKLNKCRMIFHKGCGGNRNVFKTRLECHHKCVIVEKPPKVEEKSEVTEKVKVEEKGKAVACLQPTSTGNICPGAAPNKSYLRFSFDPKLNRCRMIFHKGCGGNRNVFKTGLECHQKCVGKAPKVEEKSEVTEKVKVEEKSELTEKVKVEEKGKADACLQPIATGKTCPGAPAYKSFDRFAYDSTFNVCRKMFFWGCDGNQNRFMSSQECERVCVKTKETAKVEKKPELTEKVKVEKKPELTEKVKVEKKPELTEKVKVEKKPEVTEKVKVEEKLEEEGKEKVKGKGSCLEGWTPYNKRRCVRIVEDELKRASARAVCQGLGGDLVVFKKRDFWRFVNSLLDKSKRYWIGLNDLNHDGKFTWLDESTPIKFTKWLRTPINETGNEWCVEMAPNHKGRWNDKNCEFRRSAICQMNSVKGKRGLRRAQRKADKFEKRRQRKKEKYQKRQNKKSELVLNSKLW